MVSKTSWYIIGITIAFVVAIFALLAILTPDIFAGIVTAVDNALYIAFGTVPLLALETGTLALIGVTFALMAIGWAIGHFGIERWWNNRKLKKQTASGMPASMKTPQPMVIRSENPVSLKQQPQQVITEVKPEEVQA